MWWGKNKKNRKCIFFYIESIQKKEKITNEIPEKIRNLLTRWGLSGAKICESCRSRQEASNEYLLAKIGVDTAENETLRVWKWFWRAVGNLDILDPLRKSCSNSKILRSEMRAQETRSSMASKVNRRCEPSSSHFIVTLSSLLHKVKIFFICSRFMPRTFLLSQR